MFAGTRVFSRDSGPPPHLPLEDAHPHGAATRKVLSPRDPAGTQPVLDGQTSQNRKQTLLPI